MGPISNPEVKIAPKITETSILVPSKFPGSAKFVSDRCRASLKQRSLESALPDDPWQVPDNRETMRERQKPSLQVICGVDRSNQITADETHE